MSFPLWRSVSERTHREQNIALCVGFDSLEFYRQMLLAV